MLRATAWVIVDGVPVARHVVSAPTTNEFDFAILATNKFESLRKSYPAGNYLEFGPITAPWGKA